MMSTQSFRKPLDMAVAKHSFSELFSKQTDPYHQARLLAASATHGGNWLHATPTTACGLRLSDEAVSTGAGLSLTPPMHKRRYG